MNKIAWRLGAILLLATAADASHAQACRNPDPLRVAVIPQMKDQTSTGHYDVLIETLADELGCNVVLTPAGSYGAVVEGLVDGSVDLAELGTGSYALARDRGADLAAFASFQRQANVSGPATYHSVLITRKDAGIRSLDDLRGAAVSLVDPASTSGGIVPRAALRRMTGIPLEAWFGRVSFAGSHDLAIAAVLNGQVEAAFVSHNRVNEAVYRERPATDVLHAIWRSDPIPSDPFVYQADLCQPVQDAIHRVFFERQNDLQPLFAWRGRLGFVRLSESDYQHMMPNSPALP